MHTLLCESFKTQAHLKRMSNFEASRLYESVIEEVIADSRQDFEDSGIDESTLQELRKLWCEKLSQQNVGKFNWDEEEASFQGKPNFGGESIKADSLHLNQGLELSSMNPYQSNDTINSAMPPAGSNYEMGIELPTVKQEFTDDNGLILPRINQSDGAFEFEVDIGSLSQKKRHALIKKLEAQAADGSQGIDDEDDDVFNDSDDINSDLDDDLDSERSDDDENDQVGQIMLCLYDKVQRVKNKWKCNLKEGVANINGRDYVFQRATGESEW